MKNSNQPFDVYRMVTNLIIKKLEEGVVPWKKPWKNAGLPQNLITRRPYTGINTWLLASMEFSQNYFLTFNQVEAIGATVKKGSKSTPIVFWKQEESIDENTEEPVKKSVLRYYNVFNIEQCEDIPPGRIPEPVTTFEPIKSCERILQEMPKKPEIVHNGSAACYNPELDLITMPPKKLFNEMVAYYGVLFHELVHSTGHASRLNRKEVAEPIIFASDGYSKEELVAEMGACYLKSLAGIEGNIENSAAYIEHWLQELKNNKKLIIFAAAKAQRAVDYILDLNKSEEQDETSIVNQTA